MQYDRIVLGYHGCDEEVARKIIDGERFRKSRNKYDWLGTGVYFWEFGPHRAFRFAKDQKKRRKIEKPAIVGALIQLGNCFDLMDTRFTADLAPAYQLWTNALREQAVPLPENKGDTPDKKLRFRDCAVLNWYLQEAEKEGAKYQTVRGCFTEGGPLFDGSGIQHESHIQIAIRDLTCILGVFRPSLIVSGLK
jgi:hypothetical protein